MEHIQFVTMPEAERDALHRMGIVDGSQVEVDADGKDNLTWIFDKKSPLVASKKDILCTFTYTGGLSDDLFYFERVKWKHREYFVYFIDEIWTSGLITILGIGRNNRDEAKGFLIRYISHGGICIPGQIAVHKGFMLPASAIFRIWRTSSIYSDDHNLYLEDCESCAFSRQ
jgi:hypothetical protein